ncbi:MAG: hypothetical protein JKY96_07175, partial [Phycisphaerales bacterium]|nr:hypothetical protein [Phycisphaerales bacterium]
FVEPIGHPRRGDQCEECKRAHDEAVVEEGEQEEHAGEHGGDEDLEKGPVQSDDAGLGCSGVEGVDGVGAFGAGGWRAVVKFEPGEVVGAV